MAPPRRHPRPGDELAEVHGNRIGENDLGLDASPPVSVGEVRDRSAESAREPEAACRSRSADIGQPCRSVEREISEALAKASFEWLGEPDVKHLRRTLLDVLRLLDEFIA